MIKQNALHTIRSGKDDEYYRAVTNAALYLAVAGHLSEATVLLRALWQLGLPHSPGVWLQDRALQVLWLTAGLSVPEAPFTQQPIDEIELEHRRYMGGDRYAYPMPAVEWYELQGKNAFRQAQTWFATGQYDAETLFLLKQALQLPQELAGYEFRDATALAAETAARSGDEATALAMLDRWVGNVLTSDWFWAFVKLAASRHVAPLLLRGVLQTKLALTRAEARQDVEELKAALQARAVRGPQPIFTQLSWPQLLEKLNELILADDPEILEWTGWLSNWVGNAGADETQIKAKEKELGLTLPADYRAFLLTSNGLVGSPTDPEMLPVAEIGYYKAMEDPELYAITATYADSESEDGQATIAPYLKRALLISRVPAEQMLWLIPPTKPQGEWQTWFFAAWLPGEERFPSFRNYVEKRVQSLDESTETWYWNR